MELSIEEIVYEYGAYLYRYALFLSGHPDMAQELVQETYVKAWQKRDQLKEDGALKAWLKTICLNEFRMMLRKQKQQQEEFESIEVLEVEGKLLQADTIDVCLQLTVSKEVEKLRNGCFLAMTRKLTLPQRMAFSMVDMFGLSMKETAILIEVSETALKGLLYRARLNLDAFFANHCQFIKEENSCKCQAWIDFAQNRAKLQHSMASSFSALEFEKRGYTYQKEVREKVLFYYQHMPTTKPNAHWYKALIEIVTQKK